MKINIITVISSALTIVNVIIYIFGKELFEKKFTKRKRLLVFLSALLLSCILFIMGQLVENDTSKDSKLQLVDIRTVEIESDYYVEIKVRNTGDSVAYIKKVVFHVMEIYPLLDTRNRSYYELEPTAIYDIYLDEKEIQEFHVSQVVSKDDADNFRLKVISTSGNEEMGVIYLYTVSLIFDENDKTIESSIQLSYFPNNFECDGFYEFGFNYANWFENYNNIMRLNSLSNCKKSETFELIVSAYQEGKIYIDSHQNEFTN